MLPSTQHCTTLLQCYHHCCSVTPHCCSVTITAAAPLTSLLECYHHCCLHHLHHCCSVTITAVLHHLHNCCGVTITVVVLPSLQHCITYITVAVLPLLPHCTTYIIAAVLPSLLRSLPSLVQCCICQQAVLAVDNRAIYDQMIYPSGMLTISMQIERTLCLH